MRRYETKVLSSLLDKYESSLLYTGDNKRRQRITCPVTEKTFPEYFNLSSMIYDQIHEEFLELESRNLVKLVWQSKNAGHVLKEVELNVEHTGEVYRRLKRIPRAETQLSAVKVLGELGSISDGVTENAREWLENKITAGESVKKFVDISRPREMIGLLLVLHAVVANKKEMYVREFSILHFNDSKEFEKMEGKILTLIREFYRGSEKDLAELSDEQILNFFGIYKNPAYLMVKGAGIIKMCLGSKAGETVIHLRELSGGIGIHSQDLEQVEFVEECRVEQVMTIENLTVFHRFELPDTLLIYLGGYHTAVRRRFLKKVYEAFPGARYLHFGDIDCGGFKILEDLKEKTGIAFSAYMMNEDVFRQYERFSRPLSQYDKKELERMLEDISFESFRGILELMLKRDGKLEQECIGL